MATMKTRTGPGSRLEAGAKILMAAGAVDTRLIARRARDELGQSWETALAALKNGARAADDEGGPHLYATLFEWRGRSGKKNQKAKPAQTPAPPAPNA